MKEKRRVRDMTGFCRFPDADGASHRQCRWGPAGGGYETPSSIVTCMCECHADRPRVMVPKVGGEVRPKIVPKK